MTDLDSPPSSTQIEISLFGPGFGESIAIHLANNQWILVDSCTLANLGLPASIAYLGDLNVDAGDSVQMIIATHWHDDHISGLHQVLKQCNRAELVISSALSSDEFATLARVYASAPLPEASGIDEMRRSLQILDARRKSGQRFHSPRFASADTLLFKDDYTVESENISARIHSLSPSDAARLQAALSFTRSMPSLGTPKKRIASPGANLSSIVLWVKIEDTSVLLGADLEDRADPSVGWTAILDGSAAITSRAEVFKVPHHGSTNAQNERVWKELLVGEPHAILTPFTRLSSPLPTNEGIEWITQRTPNVFITSRPTTSRARPRISIVRDEVEQATRSFRTIEGGWGHIRLRKEILADQGWTVELFGDAQRLA